VSKVEFFSEELCFKWFVVNDHPGFAWKVIENPDIMIPCEKVHRYTAVADLRNGAEYPDKSLWRDFTVFKPEIKDITKEIDTFSILFHPV